MPTVIRLLVLGYALLGIMAIAGCGGGGDGDGDEIWSRSGRGTLSNSDPLLPDDSYYDVTTFRAPKNGNLTVSMDSRLFVPYVLVFEGTGSSKVLIDEDVDWVTFYAEANIVYTVYFNSRDPLETGAYNWLITYPSSGTFRSPTPRATPGEKSRKLLKESVAGPVTPQPTSPK